MSDIVLRPTYWASFSGGKDSLYMLYYILQHLDVYPLDGVVHYELEIDFPFIHDVVDYVEAELKRYKVPVMRIRPRRSWYELYEQYGYPTRIARWCNSRYMLDAAKQHRDIMRAQGKLVINYIGFCADEDKRFKYALGSREDNVRQIYPLAEAGIEEHSILEWARTQPIYNDYYVHNDRCSCMGCPCSSRKSLAYTAKHYPKEYASIMRLAGDTEKKLSERYGRQISVWHGESKYNTPYVMRNVQEILQRDEWNDAQTIMEGF